MHYTLSIINFDYSKTSTSQFLKRLMKVDFVSKQSSWFKIKIHLQTDKRFLTDKLQLGGPPRHVKSYQVYFK